MRIAYIINSVEGGGAAAPVPAVTQTLREAGCTVELFALTRADGRGLPAMEASGLTAHVRAGGRKDHLAALRWLDGQMARFRPDLLWTSLTRATLLGQIVGARRRVPVVSWQHAAWLKPANRWLLRRMRDRSMLWVGDSATVTDVTIERLGIAPDRIMTWPLFAARTDGPRPQPWAPGQAVRIGSLGRLHPVKGYDVLIDALALLRAQGFAPPAPFTVTIAGDGAGAAALAARAQAAGVDAIRFAGFTDRPGDFLGTLHLYCQPSRSEGLCIAAHEAMAAGLPVIASAVGEMPRSIVEGETGLTVPPADPPALAGAFAALLGHPARLAAMGEAARARTLDRFGEIAFAQAGRAILTRVRDGTSKNPRI